MPEPKITTDYTGWSDSDLANQFKVLIAEMSDRGRPCWETAFPRTDVVALGELEAFLEEFLEEQE